MLNFPVDFFRYLIHVYKVNVDAAEKAITNSKSKQKNIPSIKLKNRDLEELIILVEDYGNLKEKKSSTDFLILLMNRIRINVGIYNPILISCIFNLNLFIKTFIFYIPIKP